MALPMGCRFCRVEFETIKLAGSRAMVLCIACEQLGFADEIQFGAPLWAAEIGERRRRSDKKRRVSGSLRVPK